MKKLFYIEKESFLRDMLEELLKRDGGNCYSVESVDDCLYLISDQTPSVVMIDVETAGEQLISFAEKIENIGNMELVLTGTQEKLDEIARSSKLFSRYITKPLSPTGLIEQVFGTKAE